MVCLGNKGTRDKFIFMETDDEWIQSGAFCVKFYDGGKEDIVIVDDCFPFLGGELAFVTTPSRFELWPCILEKAYAKKHGSYQTIKAGLVSNALAELTDGIPEMYKIA